MKITNRKDIKDITKFTGICEYPNGDKYWYKNGLKHREDGPAIEYADGDKYWLKNGKLHREDGPAVEWSNGDKIWYINGKQYIKKDYYKKLFKLGKISEELLFLELL